MPKCPLEHIFTVFKVPFLKEEKRRKKMVQRQGNGLLFCLLLKLSQKSKISMHLVIHFFSGDLH